VADRAHRPLALSTGVGGINRFAEEAKRNQCADALNVVGDQAEVRRRPAFVPVGSGPPHLLPAGLCLLYTSSLQASRTATLNDQVFWVGCADLRFDGIDFRFVTSEIGAVALKRYTLDISAWDGAAWKSVPSFVDETTDVAGTDDTLVPLQKSGRVYWHTDSFDWKKTTIDGTEAFWIQLDLHVFDSLDLPFASNVVTIDKPGVRIFNFAPVNAIMPVRIEGRNATVIAGDLLDRDTVSTTKAEDHRVQGVSGLERGAQLGVKIETTRETDIAPLLEDETACIFSQVDWPRPAKAAGATPIGTPGLSYGTSNVITKMRTELYDPDTRALRPYRWPTDGWRGGALSGILTPIAAFSTTVVRVASSGSGLDDRDGFYRHCRLRWTTGGGGATAGDEHEIIGFDAGATVNTFTIYPALAIAPNGTARFEILAPHALAMPLYPISERALWMECYSNDEDTITPPAATAPYAAGWFTSKWMGHLLIGRELRWVADASEAWSGVVDAITGRLICTNGSGLLEFDGRALRRLRADFRSQGVLDYIGALPDTKALDANTYRVNPLAQLRRSPPAGRFVAQHQTRIIVAGDPNDPLAVRWSAPGALNNAWPWIYEDIIRDEEGDGVSGMVVVEDRLVIFTPTSLHEAVGPDENGRYSFAPLVRGLGFVAHAAVCVVAGTSSVSQLVGVSASGIYSWAGGEPTMLLDQWERLVPGGVNGDRIRRACAVSAPKRAWALFAVPSAGSNVNDTILVWDHLRNRWWRWTCPYGVASMAIDNDTDGRERILFGTADGYVMTLAEAANDDGEAIESWVRTLPYQPAGGLESGLSAVMLTARTLAAGQQVTLEVLGGDDDSDPISAEHGVSVDKGAPVWGSATWGSATWASAAYKTVRDNLPHYARAHRVALIFGGAYRWAVRGLELLLKPRTRSGR